MAPDFFNLSYLAVGSAIQQEGFQVIKNSRIMELLRDHQPVLAGTLPLDLFIEKSDLDILCCSADLHAVSDLLHKEFSHLKNFKSVLTKVNETDTLIVQFYFQGFQFEIFVQPVATRRQTAFLHLMKEFDILERFPELRIEILKLKQSGFKTEPAFAKVLALPGDPYQAILNFHI